MATPPSPSQRRIWGRLAVVCALLLVVDTVLWAAGGKWTGVLTPVGLLCLSGSMLTANTWVRRTLLGASFALVAVSFWFIGRDLLSVN